MTNKVNHTKMIKSGLLLGATLGTVLLAANDSYALGFLIPNQDAFAIGRGNAFAATANNPSAIYYNPAGITQIPNNDLQIGDLNYLGLNVEYHSPIGAEANTKFEVIPIPQLFYTLTPTNLALPFSFGLGVYAPFGLGVKWPENSIMRPQAIDSKLYYFTVNPVVAYKLLDSLSIAVGPTFNYSKIGFNRGLASANDYFEFKGDDFSYGLTAGILWQPVKEWSFGVDYKLASTMHYSGTSTYNTGGGPIFQLPTSARVPFPETISGGISYRPTPKWNVEVDVDYIDWHTLGNVTLNGTSPVFVNNLVLHLNWHDSFQYKAGVTRYFDNGWYASCGYFFSTDTTDSADYTAAVPDSNLHVGSIGLGRDGVHWHWALSGQLIAGSRKVDSAPFPGNTSSPVDTSAGTYAFFVPAVSVSVGYRF